MTSDFFVTLSPSLGKTREAEKKLEHTFFKCPSRRVIFPFFSIFFYGLKNIFFHVHTRTQTLNDAVSFVPNSGFYSGIINITKEIRAFAGHWLPQDAE